MEFILFVGLFFWLIEKEATFFENKLKIVQIELGSILFLTVFLFISAGFNLLFGFFLVWLLLAVGCYLVYIKRHKKIGFIGVSFCLYFTVVFIYLELFLLNFNL